MHSRRRTTCLSSKCYKITETCGPPMTTLNNGFIFTLHVHCSICIAVGIDDFCFERPVIFSTTTRKPSVHLWLEINYLSENNEINMCFRLNFQRKRPSEIVQFGEWFVHGQYTSSFVLFIEWNGWIFKLIIGNVQGTQSDKRCRNNRNR